MFVLLVWFLTALQCISTALSCFKGKLLLALPGRLRPIPPPVDALKEDVALQLAEDGAAGPHVARDIVACPSNPPAVNPTKGCCESVGLKGNEPSEEPSAKPSEESSAERTLVHNSVRAHSVSESTVSSNTSSPPRESMAAVICYPDGTQSPTSSDTTESNYTPTFDMAPTINSPYEPSTAPTSPASDTFHSARSDTAEEGTVASVEINPQEVSPLSALMIECAARRAEKRYAYPKALLLAKIRNTPQWKPEMTQPSPLTTCHPTSDADDDEGNQSWEEIDLTSGKQTMPASANTPATPQSHVDDPFGHDPINPPQSWYSKGALPDLGLNEDDASIYSLESYVEPGGSNHTSQDVDETHGGVPDIILTSPSIEDAPGVSKASNRVSKPVFAEDPANSGSTESEEEDGRPSSPSLLWPYYQPGPRPAPRIKDVEEEDESAAKRKRRNGCRLTATTSIDIIMAGLDQDFPDGQPVITASDYAQSFREVQHNIAQAIAMVEGESNGSSTSYFDEEASIESRWSDDSDEDEEEEEEEEEGTEGTGLAGAIFGSVNREARISSRQPSTLNAARILHDISEEELSSSESNENSVYTLGSRATIHETRRFSGDTAPPVPPTTTISNKQWVSTTEDRTRLDGLTEKKRKHHSAPVLSSWDPNSIFELASQARCHTRGSSLTLNSRQRHSKAFDLPEAFYGPSRSSTIISPYQRPWTLYNPAKSAMEYYNDQAQESSRPSSRASITSSYSRSWCPPDAPLPTPPTNTTQTPHNFHLPSQRSWSISSDDSSASSTTSSSSSPTTSVSTPDSATIDLPAHENGVALFADKGRPVTGLEGILAAFKDSTDFSGAHHMNDSNSEDALDDYTADDEDDTSEIDFAEYYAY